MSLRSEGPRSRSRLARVADLALGEGSNVARVAEIASSADDDSPAHFTREHRKAVPPAVREALSALRGADNWHSLLYVSKNWALIIAISVAAEVASFGPEVFGISALIYALAVVIIGSRQRALMNLVHQASHDLLFKNRFANRWVGEAFLALPLLTTVTSYAAEHRMHHGWLWSFRHDPKTRRYRTLGLIEPSGFGAFVRRHVVKPLLLMHVPFNVWSAIWKRDDARGQTLLRLGFWCALAIVAFTLHVAVYIVFFWMVPFLTTFQVVRYFGEMAEHSGLKTTNPWFATRSWTSSWLVRSLLAPHTDHYHLTHHLWPRIPHYRIAEAHRLAMQIPEYASGHHCDGFFWARGPHRPCVVADILRPQGMVGPAHSTLDHDQVR